MRLWPRKRTLEAAQPPPLRRHVWEVDMDATRVLGQVGVVGVRCVVCGVLRDREAVERADAHRWSEDMRRDLLLEPCRGCKDAVPSTAPARELLPAADR